MGRIVVGVDGSDHSRSALRWAVAQARLQQATVEAVLAWDEPYAMGGWMGTIPAPVDLEAIEKGQREQLQHIIDSTDAHDLPGPIEPIVAKGGAARTLLEIADGADLLVVGSRGHGGFMGLVLGSVSQQVAGHAPCPVVVVPGPERKESE